MYRRGKRHGCAVQGACCSRDIATRSIWDCVFQQHDGVHTCLGWAGEHDSSVRKWKESTDRGRRLAERHGAIRRAIRRAIAAA